MKMPQSVIKQIQDLARQAYDEEFWAQAPYKEDTEKPLDPNEKEPDDSES